MRASWQPSRSRRRSPACAGSGSAAAWFGFEIFQPEFELLDVGDHLLRPRPKCIRLSLRTSRFRFSILGLFRQYQRLERLDVERVEIGQLRLAGSLSLRPYRNYVTSNLQGCESLQTFSRRDVLYGHRGHAVRIGLRQSMPSSSIESCARLNETAPFSACGQMKRPRSRRL